MQAYVARLKADQSCPREIVGFFFADDPGQLFRLIDEFCDVECCEVMELGPGGIYWNDAKDYVLPIKPSEDAPGLPGGASISEWWIEALCGDGDWQRIPEAGFDHANDA